MPCIPSSKSVNFTCCNSKLTAGWPHNGYLKTIVLCHDPPSRGFVMVVNKLFFLFFLFFWWLFRRLVRLKTMCSSMLIAQSSMKVANLWYLKMRRVKHLHPITQRNRHDPQMDEKSNCNPDDVQRRQFADYRLDSSSIHFHCLDQSIQHPL